MELTPEIVEHLKSLEKKEEILECCRKLEKQLGRPISESEIFAITFGFEFGMGYSSKILNTFLINYLNNVD
jgi:hypothetical protein